MALCELANYKVLLALGDARLSSVKARAWALIQSSRGVLTIFRQNHDDEDQATGCVDQKIKARGTPRSTTPNLLNPAKILMHLKVREVVEYDECILRHTLSSGLEWLIDLTSRIQGPIFVRSQRFRT